MTPQGGIQPRIVYIECDLPDGVGLLEWRASRQGRRLSRRERFRAYLVRPFKADQTRT